MRKSRGRNSENVARQLREKIMRMELRPGELLDEAPLCAEFGLSRTPIREALIRLAADNLVELIPNRGARVTWIKFLEMREIFEALELVQGVLTRWAAIRRTDESLEQMKRYAQEFRACLAEIDMSAAVECNRKFHMAIADAAGNELLANFYGNILSRTFRIGILTLYEAPETPEERQTYLGDIEVEHDDLVRAISQRDAAGAERIARVHARAFLQRVSRYITDNLAEETARYEPSELGPM